MQRPEIIPTSDPSRLDELVRGGARLVDALALQVADLLESRFPDRTRGEREALLPDALREQAAEAVWVHYPWSRRVVRALSREAFREVRTSRNRHKLTWSEQQRLADKRIGIVGLSVGYSVAVNLALEGIGGHLVLADPDYLSLSNMNRLAASLADLGENKAVLAARRIWEIDPFLDLALWPGGLTPDRLDAFFGEGLDLVIEECDSIDIKIAVRHAARARGVPVIMDTNERGMLDVERFDQEPDRPILHGLVGDLSPEALAGLSTNDKVPYVLDIVEASRVSHRTLASLFEIGTTTAGFPQLATATSMGGAIAAEAARRVLLGEPCPSGRYHVELDESLRRPRLSAPVVRAARASLAVPSVSPPERPPPSSTPGPDEAEVRYLLSGAARAPSGGNAQPWQFSWDGGSELVFRLDAERARSSLDPSARAARIALGAAVENASELAAVLSLRATVEARGDAVCIGLERAPCAPSPRAEQVWRRATQRHTSVDAPLEDAEIDLLTRDCASDDIAVRVLRDRARLARLGTLLAALDRERFGHARLHAEAMSELRWRPDEAPTDTGIGVWTLGVDAAKLAAFELLRDHAVVATSVELGVGHGLGRGTREAVSGAAGLVWVGNPGARPDDPIAAGRLIQRLWLNATAAGLGMQPVAAGAFMIARSRVDPEFFDAAQRERLARIDDALCEVLERPATTLDYMWLRVSRGMRQAACSPRLALEVVCPGLSVRS